MRNNDNIENHMVLNTPDAPWNQPDAPEPTKEELAERVPPAEPKKQRGRPVGAKTRNRKDTNAPALPMPLRDTREGAVPRGAC